MNLQPFAKEAYDIVQAILRWTRAMPDEPWVKRVDEWALDWAARAAQITASPSKARPTRLRHACEAAAALRALLGLAPPAQAEAATAHDRAVETWLAQAQAYLAAAEPVPPPTPASSAGEARNALKQALHHGRLQPNAAWCFVCGLQNPVGLKLRFLQAGPGKALAYAVVPEAYQGYPGVVHGGIVAAMLDEVTGRAGTGTDPATARLFYTARLTIRYRRHVPTQRLLRLEGELVRDRKRFYEAKGTIYDAATNQVLAQSEALLAEVPQEEREQMNPAELGWRIYPLEDCPS